MKDFKHKKSLGQHFLSDTNIIKKIVDLAHIEPGEPVWEVGPGKGILTQELLRQKSDLTCFEIDDNLYEFLEKMFEQRMKLVKRDVLRVKWEELFPESTIKIVANLPYQITSPFLFRVAKYAHKFSKVVVMIQREVALRINAGVGTKDYGILSLKMQYYFKPNYEFTVKPHMFTPPPKVDSAVISLTPRLDKPVLENEKLFWQIIENAFGNRRKMLRRNLRQIISPEEIETIQESGILDLKRRGETLTEAEYIQLYEAILTIKRSKND